MMHSIFQHTNFKKLSLSLIAFTFLLMDSEVNAQNAEKFIRNGNKYYSEDNFAAAELKYTNALAADPNSEKGLFNQGNAYYKQEKYEESLQNYEMVAELLMNPMEKASAYHNLGNAHFKNQKLEESIEAYKNALRNNPNDADTKYNLALAKKMLEQQQQENQDQNQDQENQDQENQDQDQDQDQQENDDQGDNKDEQQKDGEGEDEQEQNSESQDQGEEQDKKEGEQQEEKQGEEKGEPKEMQEIKLTPEQVEQLLKALAQDENKIQEKLMKKKMPASPNKSDKDW